MTENKLSEYLNHPYNSGFDFLEAVADDFPYHWYFGNIGDYDEILAWCEETLECNFCLWIDAVSIKNEDDMILFKMVWT